MKTLNTALGILGTTLALSASAIAQENFRFRGHNDLDFRTRLSGDEEVPEPVDTDTSGRAVIEFNRRLTEGEFRLRVNEGKRISQTHIHCAPEGENGPVVVFLAGFHELGWDVDGLWVNNATITDDNVIPTNPDDNPTCPNVITDVKSLVDAIREGNAYVNVHSVANPAGEVRGQLESRDLRPRFPRGFGY